MTRRFILAALVLATVAAAQDITSAERQRGLEYLSQTRSDLLNATKGLSDAQWKFKSSPGRWSVAEIVEHITVTEQFINQGIFGEFDKGAPPATRDAKSVDSMILTRMPDRSVKAKAPEPLVPSGRWTPQVTMENFAAVRTQTAKFLQDRTDLRAHVVSHPAFGPLDGYEWVLAIAAHAERHLKQLNEVKADPNFPAH